MITSVRARTWGRVPPRQRPVILGPSAVPRSRQQMQFGLLGMGGGHVLQQFRRPVVGKRRRHHRLPRVHPGLKPMLRGRPATRGILRHLGAADVGRTAPVRFHPKRTVFAVHTSQPATSGLLPSPPDRPPRFVPRTRSEAHWHHDDLVRGRLARPGSRRLAGTVDTEISGSLRVEQDDWQHAERHKWVARLDEAIAACPESPVLIAHSLGCPTVAHWVSDNPHRTVRAALMVTPADIERNVSGITGSAGRMAIRSIARRGSSTGRSIRRSWTSLVPDAVSSPGPCGIWSVGRRSGSFWMLGRACRRLRIPMRSRKRRRLNAGSFMSTMTLWCWPMRGLCSPVLRKA